MNSTSRATIAENPASSDRPSAALTIWSNLLANAARLTVEEQIECLDSLSMLYDKAENWDRAQSCIRLSIILKSRLSGPKSTEVLLARQMLNEIMKKESGDFATFRESQKYAAVAQVLSAALISVPRTKLRVCPDLNIESLEKQQTRLFDGKGVNTNNFEFLDPNAGRLLAEIAIDKLFAA